MSDDLIRRSDAIKVIDRMKHRLIGNGCTYEFMRQMIEELPPIEPIRGEWEEKETFHNADDNPIIEEWQSARCSVCHKYHTTPYMYYFNNYNFCPNCGASMREREGEQWIKAKQ